MISSCANFSKQDQVVLSISKCVSEQKKSIPSHCLLPYQDHIFEGDFVNLRSKFIGDVVRVASLEIQLGLKSVMCKTKVTQQNHKLIRQLKKGDLVRATGVPTSITHFKGSKHSYLSIENCTLLF